MSTLAIRLDPHAVDVRIDASASHFVLADGREISAPLEWFPGYVMLLRNSVATGDSSERVSVCIGPISTRM